MVVCDGLKGLPDAIGQMWPQAVTQTCIVHLLRNSYRYASRRDWDAVAKALRPVHIAPSESAALDVFAEFSGTWEAKYRPSSSCGRAPGPSLCPFRPSTGRSAR